jgi:hypothetical protein
MELIRIQRIIHRLLSRRRIDHNSLILQTLRHIRIHSPVPIGHAQCSRSVNVCLSLIIRVRGGDGLRVLPYPLLEQREIGSMPGWEDGGTVGAVAGYELTVYAVPRSIGVAVDS